MNLTSIKQVLRQKRLLVSCCFVALTSIANAQSQNHLKPEEFSKLSPNMQTLIAAPQAKANQVKVIVDLRDPEPVSTDLSQRALSDTKQRVAAIQQQFLSSFLPTKHLSQKNNQDDNPIHIKKRYQTIPTIAMTIPISELTRLAKSPYVENVVEDMALRPQLKSSIPLIAADQVHAMGYVGSNKVVVVLDTGVESYHPFLKDRVVWEACYSSIFDSPYTAKSLCPNGDEEMDGEGAALTDICIHYASCSHGTHVAGIIAGSDDNFSGVAKGANIIAIQVFTQIHDTKQCGHVGVCLISYISDQISALEKTLELSYQFDIAAVNMSLGGGMYSNTCDNLYPSYSRLIDQLRKRGIATVVASGNDSYSNATGFPGCLSKVVTVGSTTKKDNISSFTSMAEWVDILAPGSSIYSSVTGEGFEKMSGTSMATPHVAGAWALLKDAKPDASVTEVLTALQKTGIEIFDPWSGIAVMRIQLDEAVKTLLGLDDEEKDDDTAAE